jgi:hypothetical protein
MGMGSDAAAVLFPFSTATTTSPRLCGTAVSHRRSGSPSLTPVGFAFLCIAYTISYLGKQKQEQLAMPDCRCRATLASYQIPSPTPVFIPFHRFGRRPSIVLEGSIQLLL